MDETHFGPQLTVTRGQAVTFLWRSEGCPEPSSMNNPFEDVPSTEYYYKPILWAVEKGITKGVDETHFNPSDTLSTAHIITFLYRTKNPGTDGWWGEAEYWAEKGYGIGKPFGVSMTVDNTTDCPRCYVVQFLYRERASRNELSENDLFMFIQDIMDVEDKGIIITGRIHSGKVKPGDTIRILTFDAGTNEPTERTYTVRTIEQYKRAIAEADAGDNVGILLKEAQSTSEFNIGDVMIGADVLMTPQTSYKGKLTLLTKEQGGRHEPISNSYRPQIYIGTADVAGAVSGIPEDELNPGETAADITITLSHPATAYVGQVLAFREGGRTSGYFTVESVER